MFQLVLSFLAFFGVRFDFSLEDLTIRDHICSWDLDEWGNPYWASIENIFHLGLELPKHEPIRPKKPRRRFFLYKPKPVLYAMDVMEETVKFKPVLIELVEDKGHIVTEIGHSKRPRKANSKPKNQHWKYRHKARH